MTTSCLGVCTPQVLTEERNNTPPLTQNPKIIKGKKGGREGAGSQTGFIHSVWI